MSGGDGREERRRLGELYERVLDLPPEARAAFIAEASEGDLELKAELSSLLASHLASPDYLEGLAERVLPGALGPLGEGAPGRRLRQDPLPSGHVVGRYEILERIGGGGMGTVYRARDRTLDRMVALKFLPWHLEGDSAAHARLAAEARAASALDHPNIAVVYEIGMAEGPPEGPGRARPFIAMAWYSGETLVAKVSRGPVAVRDTLDWAMQIADGLGRAHEAGIVHRDVKAANILVTDRGRVKILDFGIAKVNGLDLTREGARLGTVAYMSPEQTRGDPVDPRTDLWSLGVLLYEMLTGTRPFRGHAEEVVLYAIRHDEPPALETRVAEVPQGLSRIVHRCLVKNPAERYAKAADVLDDLRAVREGTRGGAPGSAPAAGLVVLPFLNISPDPDNEYFSDGLTEEVIAHLSRIRALRVISRTSAMRLKGSDKDILTIGRELGVRYVLEGSVRKSGRDLRISARLIDARLDEHLWSGTYAGTVADVLAIQERVGREIAGALRIELSPAEARELSRRSIEDPMALESYLRARQEMWTFSRGGLERAGRHIQNALDLVGENELLLAALGQIHVWFLQSGAAPDPEHLERADAAADAIFNLAPDSRHGHRLRGFVAFQRGHLRAAVPHLQRSLEADPDDPDALATLGYVYCLAGREDLGLDLFARLLEIDPLTPLNHGMPGFAAILQGRFADAVEPYRTFLRMEEDGAFAMMNWVWVMGLNDRLDEAEPVVRRIGEEHAGTPFASTAQALFHGWAGERDAALDAISPALREAAGQTEMFARFLAGCLALAGDVDGALTWLERAVDLGLCHHPWLSRIDPALENVRTDPRFGALMERVEGEWRAFGAAADSEARPSREERDLSSDADEET